MLRTATLVITFLAGFIMIAAFFFDVGFLSVAEAQIQDWGVIVAAFALAMASINLIQVNVNKAVSSENVTDKICSFVLLASLAGMSIIGLTKGPTSDTYNVLFDGIMAPGQSTVWALGVFYIASAAYRAFRVKNADAGLLLFSAAFVMLGAVPVGEVIWSGVPAVSQWIVDVPNMAGMRGMLIGAGIGAFSGGLRLLLGIDRTEVG
ncbi:MAG: hypothetical protein ACOX34_01395 [Bacillota bacterium]|jgi:hypothetical protein|nr:hypothetical protein [Candidatus Fermentithermobacillaceae bacterium]